MSTTKKWIVAGLLIIAVAVVWFAAVDFLCIIETCPHCLFQRNVVQYRVLGVPLCKRTSQNDTLITLVARDLGVPCQHDSMNRMQKERRLGLCVPWGTNFQGTVGLAGDLTWYNKEVSSRVAALSSRRPEVRDEFRIRVLERGDMEYWRRFIGDVKNAGATNTPETDRMGGPSDEGAGL